MNQALTTTKPSWLDTTLYPFTPRRFRTSEGEMSYVDEGEGPVVLFVHGTPSWSFEWRDVIQEMRKSARCIAVDHLGFGLSDKPQTKLTPGDHARRLRALVEHLDLNEITLIVHDFGGPIGLPLALEGGRVKRVLMCNTWMWDQSEDPQLRRIDSFVRSWLGRLLYKTFNFSPRVILPSALGKKTKLTKAEHRHYMAPFDAREEREGTYAMALALKGESAYYASLWAQRAALVKLPVHIVWGMQDPAFKPELLTRWQEALSHAQVTRLEGVGHFPAEEEPAAVVTALRALLR